MSNLAVSCSPHISNPRKTHNVMLDVLIALAPAVVASVIFFGYDALIVTAISVAACVASEYAYHQIVTKFKNWKDLGSLKDLTAVITGVLLGMNLPANAKWYAPLLGGIFAIVAIKLLFGGIGKNIVNPALAGRVFLVLSFGAALTGTWLTATAYETGLHVVTSAPTAMEGIKTVITAGAPVSSLGGEILDMFLGKMGGSLGETSVLALLLGFGWLVYRKVIDWKGPLIFIAATALFTLIFAFFKYNGNELSQAKAFEYAAEAVLPSILSGGLFLGAVFMATDYATSPNSMWGNVIYYAGCGLLTAIFRFYSGMNEGVSFAILLMNLLVPIIDKYVFPRHFGFKPLPRLKEAK